MSLPRFLVPSFGVLLLAALIGCGGSSNVSFPDDDTNSGGTESGGTEAGGDGGGTGRVPAGNYTVTLNATRTNTSIVYRAASGATATAASNGAASVSFQLNESGFLSSRLVSVAVTEAGVATGTITIGTDTPRNLTSGTVVANSNGTYLLTVKFNYVPAGSSTALYTETDKFTLTPVPIP